MTPGQVVTITVHVFITQDGGTLDNEACVDPNNTIAGVERARQLQDASRPTVVPAAPDLRINKSADKSTVTAGRHAHLHGDGLERRGTPRRPTEASRSPTSLPTAGRRSSRRSRRTASPARATACNAHDVHAAAGRLISTPVRTTPHDRPSPQHASVDQAVRRTRLSVERASARTTRRATTQASRHDRGRRLGDRPRHDAAITDNPDPVNRGRHAHLHDRRHERRHGEPRPARRRVTAAARPGLTARRRSPASNGFICATNSTVDAGGHTFDCIGDFAGRRDRRRSRPQ